MIEIPESFTLTKQINNTLIGKTIINVEANTSPHKFAWFTGDPKEYHNLLYGKQISNATSYGGMVEIQVEDMRLIFCDGTNVRYLNESDNVPKKHQLHIEFDDNSSVICSVQMYGALWLLGENQTEGYNESSKSKVNPLTDEFDEQYFNSLYSEGDGKLSAKAFLATKQRIPGLGNGVLQDILFNAKIHPKCKMNTITADDYHGLYQSVKSTLHEMTVNGGRNTERDLFGVEGGYKTIFSSKTRELPCPVCGSFVVREGYLGGNIYYCPQCQRLEK